MFEPQELCATQQALDELLIGVDAGDKLLLLLDELLLAILNQLGQQSLLMFVSTKSISHHSVEHPELVKNLSLIFAFT